MVSLAVWLLMTGGACVVAIDTTIIKMFYSIDFRRQNLTSMDVVYRRQILTSTVGPRTERVNKIIGFNS